MSPPPLSTADTFLRPLARITLVVAIAGVAWALLQLAVALFLPDAGVARLLAAPGTPPGLAWVLEHRRGLALAVLLPALALLAIAWGLLRYREWARLAFIVLLVAGALANFAGLALIDPLFDGIERVFPAELLDTPDGRQFVARMRVSRAASWITGLAGALAFAGLHGWLAWKLCSAPVRARFEQARQAAGGA